MQISLALVGNTSQTYFTKKEEPEDTFQTAWNRRLASDARRVGG